MEQYMQLQESSPEVLTPALVTITDKLGIGFGPITAPEFSQSEIENEAQEMAKFRRQIDWRNPAVCFDGRTVVLGEDEEPLPLGAHIAGGAETVLVAAKSVNYILQGKELLESLKSKGFTFGGHDADSNKANNYENGTGCGACDGCESNCDKFRDNIKNPKVESLMKALLGPNFDQSTYDETKLLPCTERLSELVGDDLIETLNDDGEGVHGHTEIALVVEYEEGVSFDRDAYFAATGKKVFPVQLWYLKKVADAMATGVEAEKQAERLYNDMVAFQVATYLGLCDGNHRAVIFQP